MEREGEHLANGSTPLISSYNPSERQFTLEITSWLQALQKFPSEISPKLVHGLIKEMSGTFLFAIKGNFAFSLIEIAERIDAISNSVVPKKEIVFSLIAHLPSPKIIDQNEKDTLLNIIGSTAKEYPEIVKRFEKKLSQDSLL